MQDAQLTLDRKEALTVYFESSALHIYLHCTKGGFVVAITDHRRDHLVVKVIGDSIKELSQMEDTPPLPSPKIRGYSEDEVDEL